MLKTLISQIKQYKSNTIKTPIYVAIEVIMEVLIPYLMAILVDQGIENGDMKVIWIYGFFPHHRSLYFLFISYPGSWIFTIIMQAVCFYFVRKQCRRQPHLTA